jgi:hypothetical protein
VSQTENGGEMGVQPRISDSDSSVCVINHLISHHITTMFSSSSRIAALRYVRGWGLCRDHLPRHRIAVLAVRRMPRCSLMLPALVRDHGWNGLTSHLLSPTSAAGSCVWCADPTSHTHLTHTHTPLCLSLCLQRSPIHQCDGCTGCRRPPCEYHSDSLSTLCPCDSWNGISVGRIQPWATLSLCLAWLARFDVGQLG